MNSVSQNGVSQSTLVQCAISQRTTETLSLSLYADMSTVVARKQKLPGDELRKTYSTRGQITDFSRKSRKRMIDRLARKRNYSRPLFMTLTIPDEVWFGMDCTYERFQQHLEAFLARLRRAYPDCSYTWRKERQDRKSGKHIGEIVPHLHLILDGIMDDVAYLRKEMRRWWMEIITDNNISILVKGCRIDLQVAKSRKHAYYYVSKYTAKMEDVTIPLENGDCQPVDSIGRIWGISTNWDTSESITVKLTYQQYVQWKRLVSRWLKSKGSHYANKIAKGNPRVGCSVYGLGDMSHSIYESLYDSAAFKLLMHVLELA